jgi:ribosomal protein S18 acetylase RimI-like enzyme
MVRLRPMTVPEFETLRDWLLPDYAAQHVRAGDWTSEEALERARGEFRELLPAGVATAEHFFWTIRADPGDERVGDLWCALRPSGAGRMLWIYWIGIDPAHRRHGYADEVLRTLETEARRLGASELGLHVFGSNAPARALYEKHGFAATDLVMRRPLLP